MWRKNYAKAQLQDQISMKEFLNEWRQRLAIIVMPFLGLGSLVFTPIAAIIIIMWIYIFFISSDRPLKFEMILLFGSFAAITIISCLFPFILNFTSFYSTIETNYYWIYITNFIGSLIASILYLQKILQPLRKQRAQQKIQDLKESQKELKDQQKELVKKQKQMKKELSKAKKTSDEKG
jgi:TRAP-type C4-dicarboxylate transport system permease small subunit